MPGPWNEWRHWFLKTTDDTDIASTKPTILADRGEATATTRVINVRDLTQIMVRCFGKNAEDDTMSLIIYAMMENGPLARVYSGTLILGAETYAEPYLESVNGQDPTPPVPAGTYFEVDTYPLTDNLLGATTPTPSATRVTSHLLLPTLGYKYFYPIVTGLGASESLGAIWRPTGIQTR